MEPMMNKNRAMKDPILSLFNFQDTDNDSNLVERLPTDQFLARVAQLKNGILRCLVSCSKIFDVVF